MTQVRGIDDHQMSGQEVRGTQVYQMLGTVDYSRLVGVLKNVRCQDIVSVS